MRPGNPKGWSQKGKGKNINGMMMEYPDGVVPPLLGAINNEGDGYGWYGSYDEQNDWGSQDQPLAAMARGKGNPEDPVT